MEKEEAVNTRKEFLKGLVLTNPLGLLLLNNKKDIDYVNSLLPYSTGFEIECDQKECFDSRNFLDIPFIRHVDCSSWEQRFRIPNGINGILCLYNISKQLKTNLTLNLGSGIHYHNDCIGYHSTHIEAVVSVMSNIILHALDTWEYKGKYNSRSYGGWFRWNSLRTLEYRVGEMTFDYEVLIKRILHTNELTKMIKDYADTIFKIDHPVSYNPFDKEVVIKYILSISEKSAEEKKILRQYKQSPNKLVNNRTFKI